MRTLLAFSLALSACGREPADTVDPVFLMQPSHVRAVASTDAGLAIIDATDGTVIASAPTSARVQQLALDPFRRALLTFETDDPDAGGDVVSRPLDALDVPEKRAYFDGVARLFAAPFGVIVFEQSYGSRWRLLGSPRGIPAPVPTAVWSSGDVVEALTNDDEKGWASYVAALRDGALTVEPVPFDSTSPSARGIALGLEVVDARALDGLSVILAATPSRLVATNGELQAAYELGDDVRADALGGLVVVDDYVLVGTSHAVRGFRVRRVGEKIDIESVFVAAGVRAPLAGPL